MSPELNENDNDDGMTPTITVTAKPTDNDNISTLTFSRLFHAYKFKFASIQMQNCKSRMIANDAYYKREERTENRWQYTDSDWILLFLKKKYRL